MSTYKELSEEVIEKLRDKPVGEVRALIRKLNGKPNVDEALFAKLIRLRDEKVAQYDNVILEDPRGTIHVL